ncbi:MAG TPA: insulinase family protein [Candidatus Aminicenantes bacterium]|nr:insulinase family protein [Candidatus Aminicenantes bacterium]
MRPGVSLLLVFSLLLCTWAENAEDSPFRAVILKNGIHALAEQFPDFPLVHLVVAIRAGSKYEPAVQRGISHLMEHLILFGKDNTGQSSFSERLRERGGFLNGHTDRDLVTLEITLPRSELEFVVGLAREMTFARRFFQKDLEREREIIRNETAEVQDNPELRGLFVMLNHLFSGHPYARSALGDVTALDSISVEEISRHYEALFRPERSAIVLVGDVEPEIVIAGIKERLGDVRVPAFANDRESVAVPPLPPLTESHVIERSMDVEQAHIWLGFRAPAYNHADRVTMRVLSQMLGQGGYSLLSASLSSRFQLVSAVSMNYQALEESGFAWIHMVLDPGHVKRARNEVMRFLKYFRTMDFSLRDLPPARRRGVFDFLATAENQLRLRSETGGEDGMDRALSYARFLLLNRLGKPKSFLERMSALSPSMLRGAAGDYLLKPPHVMVTVLPEKAR